MTESRDGCRIAYWSGGNPSGMPIVLLHGFSLDHSVWLAVCEQRGFLDRCRVVIPDLRGHGQSGRPTSADRYCHGQAWADDLDALIRASGLAHPAVVAWSYSGRMLLDYVRHHGARSLRCLNLVAAASLADPAALGPDHAVLAELCATEPGAAQRAADRFVTQILRIGHEAALYARCSAAMRSISAEQRAWLRSRPLDYDRIVTGIDVPVLVTHGALDSVLLPAHARRLTEVIPGACLSLYEHAGHAPFLEDPDRFATELFEFVAQSPASCRSGSRERVWPPTTKGPA